MKSSVSYCLKLKDKVHILEPYWDEVKISQAVGRAVRYCSHMDLPMKERNVEIFRYITSQPSLKATADQLIYDLAHRKASLISGFKECMKQAAVDCQLYAKQNCEDIPEEKCHCFQFDLESNFKNVSSVMFFLS